MSKKSPLKSSKLVRRKRRILLLKISSVILFFLIVIGGVIGVTHLGVLAITSVAVSGNASIDTDALKKVVDDNIAGNYFHLFSRSNKIIYPKQEIEADLLASFPRIQNVQVNIEGHSLALAITERSPAYTWCAGMPTDVPHNQCYFMDSEGYIFAEAPEFSGNVFFAFYGMVSNDNPITASYLNNSEFKKVDQLISFLDSKSLHPYAFRAEDTGSYELYLARGGKIIFKQGQDAAILQSNLELILTHTDILAPAKTKSASSSLEYIDLRFGNKLYYKKTGDNALQLQNSPEV